MFGCGSLIVGLGFFFITTTDGYFGLSSMEPLPRFPPNTSTRWFFPVKSCQGVRRRCKHDSQIVPVLAEALRTSVIECINQFADERWNCSLIHKTRIQMLKKAFRETAFMFAISAAGVARASARACSSGQLHDCTCDEESFEPADNVRTWMWGGCGDNVRFGSRFARRVLGLSRRAKDIRALVNLHNSNIGIKEVRRSLSKVCRCHGVSGSCSVRTCWKQLPSFHEIGNRLKAKYNTAVKIIDRPNYGSAWKLLLRRERRKRRRNRAHHRHRHNTPLGDSASREMDNHQNFSASSHRQATQRKNVRKHRNDVASYPMRQLWYLDDSPDFCEISMYSAGTKGRVCVKEGQNCDIVCCGRGYDIVEKRTHTPCRCRVVGYTAVHCDTCYVSEDVRVCK